MAVSGDTYRQVGRTAAGAVAVVCAADGAGGVAGLTVSSFVTLSFDPPLVMFAIQHDANSYRAIVASRSFGVSVLGVEQSDIARRFAVKGADKISATPFDTGLILPVPLIANALAQVECQTSQIHTSGDHAIVVGLVEAARTRAGNPLLYFARQFGSFVPLEGA